MAKLDSTEKGRLVGRIRAAMAESHLRYQQDLAMRTGMSPSNISRLLDPTNEQMPHRSTLQNIARALGTPLNRLTGES